jgi:hypothetical protein
LSLRVSVGWLMRGGGGILTAAKSCSSSSMTDWN